MKKTFLGKGQGGLNVELGRIRQKMEGVKRVRVEESFRLQKIMIRKWTFPGRLE